jgi:hypothetical protein
MRNPGIQPFRGAPGEKNRAAIVFVHGFSGDRAATWGEIPSLLAANTRLNGWDMFGFGFPSHKSFDILGLWSADPALGQISTRLNTEPALEPWQAFSAEDQALRVADLCGLGKPFVERLANKYEGGDLL